MGETVGKNHEPLPGAYIDIDERIEPGPRGTNLEGALAADLDGITELLLSWRDRQSRGHRDMQWDFSFNSQIYQEWSKFLALLKDTPHHAHLMIGTNQDEIIQGRLLRWEKYRQNYALYDSVVLSPGSRLDLAYCGAHTILSNYPHDRPPWDTDMTQIFIGDADAGYQDGDIKSGIAISMNQLAKALNTGGELRLAEASLPEPDY